MKISTKGRYGLRAMIDLAVHARGEHVALYSIADRQGVSMNYLEQVFATLRKAGLVKSVKGAQGGYELAENPADITVGDVLRVLEGPLAVIDDISERSNTGRESVIRMCIREQVWDRMNEALNSIVDGLTLEDMAERYRQLNGREETMYYI